MNSKTCIQDWFSQTAEKFNNNTAIDCGKRQFTYDEIENQSNKLANFLIAHGVAKGSLVAILSKDTVEVIIAIIGILKASCVFVPLSPDLPEQKISTIISEISLQWIIVDSIGLTKISNLMASAFYQIKIISRTNQVIENFKSIFNYLGNYIECSYVEKPSIQLEPDDMCYLYFTSGSTGKPKGIAGRLKSIAHFINWEIKTFDIKNYTRVSQLINPAFDAFLRDIFVPLCSGGVVCVPEIDTILDARQLIKWIDCQQINLIHCVPSLFRSLLNEELDPKRFSSLQYILLAGEPLFSGDVARWINVYGERIQLVNLYGASETTMTKLFYLVKPSDRQRSIIPIGKPMEGAAALVVDEAGKVCPSGMVGEIYIRTPYRSLGYYQQPELTNQVFIPNPFSKNPNDIVYKTGDLGRILEDGNFEYLGRKDKQVKIRGVRIELGEIENYLRLHPSVKDVVVVDREDSNDYKYLCAYVVLKEELESGKLRDFLLQSLSESMIPSVFVMMDTLPRTISGKVDRQSLPAPNQQKQSRTFIAPRTPIEEQLAQIWIQVLNLERVGVNDNFFELGGHSLLATQIVSRVGRAFNVEMPLRSLFESPTLASLAESIETLRWANYQPLLPISRDAKLPLSFSQQRLWFLDQLTPSSPAYNISGAVEIQGTLNIAALEQSLNEIIRRHEIWRTNFKVVDGEPIQVIASSFTLILNRVNLRQLLKEQQQAEVTRLAAQEAQKPFDLSTEPLLRVTLLQLDDSDYVLLLTVHHIVFDAWSMGVLLRELAVLYEANRSKPSLLPELPIQYADFAHWQRHNLKGEVLSTQLTYWKQKLGGKLPLLQLPTDRPRLPLPSFRGARRSLTLPKNLSEALKTLSQQQGVTLFMTLLAAFKTLLYRYTGQEDLLVGTATAGRIQPETEQLIGCFVNTLVLRTDLSGNPTFLTLLEQVQKMALAAYAHQDLPFEKLVEELQPDRDLSHSPLFQVGFAFYNAPKVEMKLSGLTLNSLTVDTETSKLDLTLLFKESEEGLTGWLEYKTELFDAATINRMLAHFGTLLAGIVSNPKQRIEQLPLLTTAQCQQLLSEWNETQIDYPDDVCVHQLFEAQAKRYPEAIAIMFNDSTLTYQELNAASNQLANYLKSLGVRPEMRVGICIERSPLMIASILGILKAGGVYVPLDPTYPKERLAFTIQDASLSVLLTQQSLDIQPEEKTTVVCLDKEWLAIARHSDTNLTPVVTPDNVAYIIYTSGSTGKPKGVILAHRGLCNLATAQIRAFDVRPDSRVLQFASLSFDASISEIFMALVAGATLCLGSTDDLLPGTNLLRLLRDRAITTVTLPPSVLAVLPVEELPALQTLIVAGEVCSPDLVARWADRRRFFNAYGPTEVTVCATIFECTHAQGQPPIGRPIANTKVYILDRHLQLVPIGVPGELYIAGIGLAYGYLNRGDLTEEKFIPNLFGNVKSERLYKTGDLARYRSDGNIEFLGRIDTQVKIRGFRIELGEIETILRQHPNVLNCVVIVDEDRFGKRLIAYIVPQNAIAINQQQLKDNLKKHLPDYMIPSVLVILDTLPLTTSGKVDRKALPAHDVDRSLKLETFVTPRDSLELELVRIWEEVLNVRPIGVADNFFDLGGHSLLAVRMMALIQQHFGQELPLAILFQGGTIEHLATILRSKTSLRPWSPLVGIQTAGSKPPLFCAHPIGGNVLGYVALGRYLSPEQPFYALQAPGVDGQQQPYTQIPDLATYYIEALQALQPSGPYFLGGHSFGGLVAFEMAQQLQKQGQEVALLAIMDTPAPIHSKVTEPEPIDDAKWLVKRAQVLERFFEKELLVDYAQLQQLEPEAQFNYFLEKLRRVNLIPPDAGQQMIRSILEVQKASHQALANYVPQVYRGKITLLQASEVVTEDSKGVFSESFRQPGLGWEKLTTEPIEIHEVPGDHVTMLAEPHVQVLADKLKCCLRDCLKSG